MRFFSLVLSLFSRGAVKEKMKFGKLAKYLEFQVIGHFCFSNRAKVPEKKQPQIAQDASQGACLGCGRRASGEPLQAVRLPLDMEWGRES